MLVLSRLRGQRIVIGEGADAVIVSVEDVSGGKVRLGIDAPAYLAVDREEVRAQKNRGEGGRR